MDVVLGVSMGSTAVQMVLVEGENADGVTVDEDNFRITAPDPQDPATSSAPGQVLSAILGTREGAAEGGYQLTSTGVAWTNPAEAAMLRDALAAYKIQNVMLVSAFLAAAALAQTVGQAIGYSHTAMLLIDPEYATVGIVDSDDGSITGVRREPLQLSWHGGDTVVQLAAMITSVNTRQAHPEGVFLVGRGIDIAALKPALEAVTPLRVSAPEEPEMALARGAALASASAPLFVSSTSALAYALDPGTGEVNQYPPAEYLSAAEVSGSEPIAYGGVPDEDADADTVVMRAVTVGGPDETGQRRRPVLLIGSVLAVIFISAVLALEVALAITIRTTVALQPSPGQNLIVPTQQAPAPAPTLQAPAPNRQLAPLSQPMSQPMPNFVARPLAAPAPAWPAPAPPRVACPGGAAGTGAGSSGSGARSASGTCAGGSATGSEHPASGEHAGPSGSLAQPARAGTVGPATATGPQTTGTAAHPTTPGASADTQTTGTTTHPTTPGASADTQTTGTTTHPTTPGASADTQTTGTTTDTQTTGASADTQTTGASADTQTTGAGAATQTSGTAAGT